MKTMAGECAEPGTEWSGPTGELRDTGVLVLANASWETASRINCHHIARRLSRDNDVVFVESIGGRRVSATSSRDLARLTRRLVRASIGPVRVGDRLWRLSRVVAPVHWRSLQAISTRLLRWQLLSAASRCFRPGPRVIWAFSPTFGVLSRALSADAVIYHCVDEHVIDAGPGGAHLEETEGRLADWADLMVVTSRTLQAAKRGLARRVLCVENPADLAHFRQISDETVQVAADMDGFKRPIVGYVGNIASYKIDLTLLRSVAEQNEDMSFVLIGEVGVGEARTSVTDFASFQRASHRAEALRRGAPLRQGIRRLYHSFPHDRCWRAQLPDEVFRAYLASGKPVVTTPLPALREYLSVCRVASDAEGFGRAIPRRDSVRYHARKVGRATAHGRRARMGHAISASLEGGRRDREWGTLLNGLAIADDALVYRGGAERVVAFWAERWPEVPIYTAAYLPDATYDVFRRAQVRTSLYSTWRRAHESSCAWSSRSWFPGSAASTSPVMTWS